MNSIELIKSIKKNGITDVKSILTDGIDYDFGTSEFIPMLANNQLNVKLNVSFISFVCLTGK